MTRLVRGTILYAGLLVLALLIGLIVITETGVYKTAKFKEQVELTGEFLEDVNNTYGIDVETPASIAKEKAKEYTKVLGYVLEEN